MNNDNDDVVMEATSPTPVGPSQPPPSLVTNSPSSSPQPSHKPTPPAQDDSNNVISASTTPATIPTTAPTSSVVTPSSVASPPVAVKSEIKTEATVPSVNNLQNDSSTVQAILAFLKKNNLTGTEELLKTELAKVNGAGGPVPAVPQDNEMGNALATYKSDGDPSSYDEAYNDLEVFIENSLDMYKHELALILYPVFVHMYLELVYNGHEGAAKEFIAKFGPRQESYYQEDIKKLSFVTKKDHMKGNELMENFNTSQFTVRMSRDTYTQLRQQKKHLSEKKHTLLWNVIQEHLYLDVYEGLPRSKTQIDSTAGAVTGEANRQANKSKVSCVLVYLFIGLISLINRFIMDCCVNLM